MKKCSATREGTMTAADEFILDYLEIRRRIERRLTGIRATIVHIAAFSVAVTATLVYYTYGERPIIHLADGSFIVLRETLVPTDIGVAFALWSLGLLIPGVLAYRASRRRQQAIEAELAERLERDDTELLGNPRRAFRVQSLLEADLRQRGAVLTPLLAFLVVNAVFWIGWMIKGANTSATWQLTPALALLVVVPALVLNALGRRRREHHTVRQIAAWEASDVRVKAKREDAERAYRLSDDGELIEGDFDDYPKAKRA